MEGTNQKMTENIFTVVSIHCGIYKPTLLLEMLPLMGVLRNSGVDVKACALRT